MPQMWQLPVGAQAHGGDSCSSVRTYQQQQAENSENLNACMSFHHSKHQATTV